MPTESNAADSGRDKDSTEPLYVLYGSQMGNSEGAAKEFCRQLPTKYTPEFFEEHGLPPKTIETTCIQLDDFLEMKHAAFTKCIVIFVSSYGVGQAPLGAYRFREICDSLSESATASPSSSPRVLAGLKYAICGLGDSTYPTKFLNPTSIDAGLTAAGAHRIGGLAKADAHGTGDQAQDKTIAKWINSIWLPLAKSICAEDEVDTKTMQRSVVQLLCRLDPDYSPPKELAGTSSSDCSNSLVLAVISVVGIAMAVAVLHLK